MVVMTPADEAECRQMLTTAYQHPGPAAVRYPRGTGPGVLPAPTLECLTIGKGEIRRQGQRIALLTFGTLLAPALEAGDTLNATVANMRFVKPIDHELILELAHTHDLIVVLEENTLIGGAGSEVSRVLESSLETKSLLRMGLPDSFIEHGEQSQMLAELGLNASNIVQRIASFAPSLVPEGILAS
jgi:1-deoxy-D-xylulose-5-phosphate synthase